MAKKLDIITIIVFVLCLIAVSPRDMDFSLRNIILAAISILCLAYLFIRLPFLLMKWIKDLQPQKKLPIGLVIIYWMDLFLLLLPLLLWFFHAAFSPSSLSLELEANITLIRWIMFIVYAIVFSQAWIQLRKLKADAIWAHIIIAVLAIIISSYFLRVIFVKWWLGSLFIIVVLYSCWVIYYLTRPKAKEMFK